MSQFAKKFEQVNEIIALSGKNGWSEEQLKDAVQVLHREYTRQSFTRKNLFSILCRLIGKKKS